MNSEEDQERREAERLERALSGKLHRTKAAPAKKWDATPAPGNLQKAKSTNNVNEPAPRHPAAAPVHHEAPVEVVRHEEVASTNIDIATDKESKKQAEEEEARLLKFMNRRGLGNVVTKEN